MGDVVGGHDFLHHAAGAGVLLFGLRQLLFEPGDDAIGQFAGALELTLALGDGKIVARFVQLALQFGGKAELLLFGLPAGRQRIRLLFDDIETQRELIGLLGSAEEGEGVRIFIGSENKLFSMSGSSMVAAPFRDAEQRIVGVVGIIGPTRLNYARIVPMVDYTAKVVGRLLDGSR